MTLGILCDYFYGLGESGNVGIPALGLGESGNVGIPALGLGESGNVGIPALRLVIPVKERAKFTAKTRSMVMIIERNFFAF
ncbi:MAG: hypothetical protein HY960_00880 [Ignavibacteriae bacterium]|nr:hypothetical protein [Ignavibacteriota bacterium]